jgi:hypothetical protein
MQDRTILNERISVFDDAFTLSIGELNKWGYLGEQPKSGMITWSKGDQELANILIHVDVTNDKPFMKLNFEFDGEPVHQFISLTPIPSNLGIGITWYFICPVTSKRARKLFQIDGKFVHRDAKKSSLYRSQAISHKDRKLKKMMDGAFAEESMDNKHFTPFYMGLPTKKFQSIMGKIKKTEGVKWKLF